LKNILAGGLDLNLHKGLGKSKTPVAGSTDLAAESSKDACPKHALEFDCLCFLLLQLKYLKNFPRKNLEAGFPNYKGK